MDVLPLVSPSYQSHQARLWPRWQMAKLALNSPLQGTLHGHSPKHHHHGLIQKSHTPTIVSLPLPIQGPGKVKGQIWILENNHFIMEGDVAIWES